MASYSTTKLGDILLNVDRYTSRESVFLPMNDVWTLETTAVVTDLDEIEDPESETIVMDDVRLEYALGIDTLKDVLINARDQVIDVAPEHFLEAFLYYYDHDAFIDLSNSGRRQ